MNTASERVLNVKVFPFTGQDPAVVGHLKKVATTFSQLYEQRQTADYDLATQWSRTEVLALIESVAESFSPGNPIPRRHACRWPAREHGDLEIISGLLWV